MSVPVSPKLFGAFANWAVSQNDDTLFDGAHTWHDAPNSGDYYGERAVRAAIAPDPANSCGDTYNRISEEPYRRFLMATGTAVQEDTVFSDRTGTHRCVRLG